MSTAVRRTMRIRIGWLEVGATLPGNTAGRVAGSGFYRSVVRPIRMALHRVWRTNQTAGSPELPVPNLAVPREAQPELRMLIQNVNQVRWYHTIDLGQGVVTPGFMDHRQHVDRYQLPASLQGLRCLDVATWDGFWAFEMERRGAAEVVALDVASLRDCDIPLRRLPELKDGFDTVALGEGFRLAHEALHSKVKRVVCNVYDLSPERLGRFDFIFISDLLIHLRNPQLALERVASVCRGRVVLADIYNPDLERYDTCVTEFRGGEGPLLWWSPNTRTLVRMLEVAGLQEIQEIGRLGLGSTQSTGHLDRVVLTGRAPQTAAQAAG